MPLTSESENITHNFACPKPGQKSKKLLLERSLERSFIKKIIDYRKIIH